MANVSQGRPLPQGQAVDLWVRRICALVVATVAAYASYVHQRDFALRGGADETGAALWPLSVDGLLLLATMGLLSPSGSSSRRSRVVMWSAFLLGIVVSLAANIAAAPTLDWRSVLVAGWPPVALLLSVELLASRGQNGAGDRGGGSSSVAETSSWQESNLVKGTDRTAGAAREAGDAKGRSASQGRGMGEPSRDRPASGGRRNAETVRQLRSVSDSSVRSFRSANKTFEVNAALLERARAEDADHRREHQRPISAETLRKRLRVGAKTSRALVAAVRADADEEHGRQVSRAERQAGQESAWAQSQ